jgi:S-adenosylmethionine decarboxylase
LCRIVKEKFLIGEEDLETKVKTSYIQKGKQIIGKHIYGNLYGCDASFVNNESALKNLVIEAAKVAKMTVWDTKAWKFGGAKGGVSALALILESHIAIHTWNEFRYATVDVFTCGDKSDPMLAFDHIVSRLKPKYVTKHFADRSSE